MGDLAELNNPVPGQNSFIACPCSPDALWAVVVVHDAQGQFITALVCGGCQREIEVSFGRPIL